MIKMASVPLPRPHLLCCSLCLCLCLCPTSPAAAQECSSKGCCKPADVHTGDVSTCSDNGEGFSIRGTHSQSGFHYPDNPLQKPALHDQPRSCHNILSYCNALWIELEIPFDRQHMATAFTSDNILINLYSGFSQGLEPTCFCMIAIMSYRQK